MTSISWSPIVATSPTLRPTKRAGDRRHVGDRTFCRVRLVLSYDAEGLAAAVVALEGDAAAELHGIDVGLGLHQLRAGAPGCVVAQVARRDRHRGAVGADVAAGLRRLVSRARRRQSLVQGGKAGGGDEVLVRRDRPVRQVRSGRLDILLASEGDAHMR